jgi:hypothetical protein
MENPVKNHDFLLMYSAVKVVYEHDLSPYDYREFSQAGKLTGEENPGPFLYTPLSLLMLFPLKFIPYHAATIVMLYLNHILILIFIYIFFFKILRVAQDYLFLILSLVYIFLFHPLDMTLLLGQINLAILILILLSWLAYKMKLSPALIALPLCLATSFKIYPVLLLLYFIAKRKYSVCIWTIGFSAASCLLTLLFLPHKIWFDWFTFVLPSGGYAGVAPHLINPAVPWNQSLNGFFSRFFIENSWSQPIIHFPILARILSYLSSFGVIAAAAYFSFQTLRIQGKNMVEEIEFSLFLLTIFLIAPFSWDHHLVVALPSIFVALYLLLHTEMKKLKITTIIIGFSALSLAWNLPLASQGLKNGIFSLAISIKMYAAIIIWIYLLQCLHKILKKNGSVNKSTTQYQEA